MMEASPDPETGNPASAIKSDGASNGSAEVSSKPIATPLELEKPTPAQDSTKEPAKKEPPAPSVSFFSLFKYADALDSFLMIVGSLGAIATGASLPIFFLFFGKLVNSFGSLADDPVKMADEVSKYAIYFVYLAIVVMVSSWLEVSCWMQTGERQSSRIRSKYLRAILRQDVGYFDVETSTGEIVNRVSSDVITVQDAIGEKVGTWMHHMSTFVTGFIVGFATIWQLTLVILGVVPFLALAGGMYAFILMGLATKGQSAYAEAGGIAEQVISSIRTVYSFVGENKAMADYSKALEKTLVLGRKQGLAKGLGMGVTFALLFCAWSLQFWVGSLLVIDGKANGGKALTTMFSVIIGGMGLGQAMPYMRAFGEGKVAAYKIFQLIERIPPIDSSGTAGKTLDKVEGNIELRNVEFTYPSRPDVPIFRNFSISIPAGKTVALVGSSGSGKSTVVALLERWYDPQGGEILIDGVNITALQLKWLRGQLGLVSQEPALFATSIRENILYGKDGATQAEIEEAAKAANAHTFIASLPDGYNTQVGERGVQMSGGQKQRIAIARAVLKNPSILLLDEATSALDSESEKVVQEALDRLMVGRTTVVIAHRLSTIRNAHSIAVVQNGKIIEQGNHEALLSHGESGAYASLIRLQEKRKEVAESSDPNPNLSMVKSALSQASSGVGQTRSGLGQSHSSLGQQQQQGGAEDAVAAPSYWRLLAMNKPEWYYGVSGVFGAICAGGVNPFFGLILSQVIRTYYYPDEDRIKSDTRKWCLVFLGLGVASIFIYAIEHFSFGAMGEALTLRVRKLMMAKLLKQEVGWFDRDENSSGAVTSRLSSDATMVRAVVGDRICLLVQSLSTISIAVIIGLVLEWKLTLVVLATYPLLIASALAQQWFLKGFAIDANSNYEKASQVASEAVGNMRTVAAFNAEDKVLGLFDSHLVGPLKRAFLRGQIAGGALGVAQFSMYSAFALALWYGGELIKKEGVDFGAVLKTFLVLIISAFAIAEAISLAPDIAKGGTTVISVFKLLDRKPLMESDDPLGEKLEKVSGTVDVKDVTFAYPSRPDVTIFRNFSLHVSAGSTVALVGQSGSGKSTIVSLIERFYDPLSGRVLVDGRDIRKLNLKWLRQQIGLVSQEPALFATTIKENILYGKENATEAEVEAAARAANAHTFISGLPEGYNTQVGERGVQMSGGQKQRIAIARAVLKNPSILLLDEATSALDAESERVVQEALDRLMVGRTTVVIAHRLSTIRNATKIAVVQEGAIIESGTHDELIGKGEGGAYWALVNLQNKG